MSLKMDLPTCNQCNENIVNDGIQCDGQCSKYYHYQCVKISKTKYKKMIFETGSWRCYNCSFGNANNLIERDVKESLQYIIHKLQTFEPMKNIVSNHEERVRGIEENNTGGRTEDTEVKKTLYPNINSGDSDKVISGSLNLKSSCIEQQVISPINESFANKKTTTQSGTSNNDFTPKNKSSRRTKKQKQLDLLTSAKNIKYENSTKESDSSVENVSTVKNTENIDIVATKTHAELSQNFNNSPNTASLGSERAENSLIPHGLEILNVADKIGPVKNTEEANDKVSLVHNLMSPKVIVKNSTDIVSEILNIEIHTYIKNQTTNSENSAITITTNQDKRSEIQLENTIKDISFIQNQVTKNNNIENQHQKNEIKVNSNIYTSSSKISHETQTEIIQRDKKTQTEVIECEIMTNYGLIEYSYDLHTNELRKLKLPTNDELKRYLPLTWNKQDVIIHDNPYNLQFRLNYTDPEYRFVLHYFTSSLPYCQIESIYRIENIHTYLMVLLKLEELRNIYKNDNITLLSLFHGTKNCNIDSIMKNNFNWRLCKKGKYGIGVCFGLNAAYSLYYTENSNTDNNFMFLCRVLAVKFCIGGNNLQLPIKPADSTFSPDGNVYVKFDDHCFYPEYLIRFKRLV